MLNVSYRPASDKRIVLKKFDGHSGTGPDRAAAQIFKRCSEQLVEPITLLARVVFDQARWPLAWRLHWIHPIYKKRSKADPANYRGVHLTPQISKIVERVIGCAFLHAANQDGLYGERQYAYTCKRSHKDALAVNVCNWLWMMEEGEAVGLYCSDVSGPFDGVRRTRLLRNCN